MYLAPQNVPHAIVLTLGNKVILYCTMTIHFQRNLLKKIDGFLFSSLYMLLHLASDIKQRIYKLCKKMN